MKIVGQSVALQMLLTKIRGAARTASAVLIVGETGTGKELVARSIHDWSDRGRGKFIAVDCGAMPDELVESELFGHRRGAFTTAVAEKPGLFEEAEGGTLFLDEIGNTSKRFQAKLLRVLQEKQVRRLGDLAVRTVDVRVIAATNSDLPTMVRRGDFREDLYYRLNIFPIQVPPLRKRLDDVPLIALHLLDSLGRRYGGHKQLSRSAMAKLQDYVFPGNVRELESLIEAAYHLSESCVIDAPDLLLPVETRPCGSDDDPIPAGNFWDSVARPYAERLITKTQVETVIRRGLAQTGGNYRKLVPLLKMPDADYKRFMDFLRRHRCNVDFRPYRKKN